jgi:hypothetical protein
MIRQSRQDFLASDDESAIDDIVDVVVVLDEEQAVARDTSKSLIAAVERDAIRMFALAGLHTYRHPVLKYGVPALINVILITCALSPAWFPDYYMQQTAIWTAHLVIIIPCYNYIRIQRDKWFLVAFGDHNAIRGMYRGLTMTFYGLFMAYCGYYMGYMLYFNRYKPWPFQIGSVLMSIGWYFFFSISSATYYFTATSFLQKAHYIKQAIKTLKFAKDLRRDFYRVYDIQYRSLRRFNNTWNRIIFIVIVVLTANIPIDLIAIIYKHAYYDAPGVFVKFVGLLWYLITICKLNYMEIYTMNYLHKHHYLQESIGEIENYIRVRPIGLNFFGIKITFEYLVKLLLLSVNLLLPTLYGLIENNIL